MPSKDDIALIGHLMHRAGFGASNEERLARIANGYQATEEELLNLDQEDISRNLNLGCSFDYLNSCEPFMYCWGARTLPWRPMKCP